MFGQKGQKAYVWEQAGTSGLFINPGNIGIGISKPTSALHIHREINLATDPYAVIRLSINDVKAETHVWDIGNFDNLHFKFSTDDNTITKMMLTPSGQLVLGIESVTSSAILQLESTNKGLLMPRMTTAEKNSIASPVNGLLVYDTDLQTFSFYDDGTWKEITINSTLNDYLTISDFNNSPAGSITNTDKTNWNTAYSWGDHSTAGYLTSYTETDPIFTAWDKDYYDLTNKPTLFDGQWNSLSGTPPNISTFANDVNYITDGNTNWNNEYGFITNADLTILWNRRDNNTTLANNNDNIGIGTSSPQKAIHVLREVNTFLLNSASALRLENLLSGSVSENGKYAWDFENNNSNLTLNFGFDPREVRTTETKFTFSKEGKLTANEFTNSSNDFSISAEGIIARTFNNDYFNVSESGIVTANKFIGDGSELTNLNLPETYWFKDSENWDNLTYKGDIIIGDAENDATKDGDAEVIMIRPTADINDDWYIGVNENEVNNSSFFIKKRNSSSGTFFIANNGNIGIGTTTPNEKLEVSGISKLNGIQLYNDADITGADKIVGHNDLRLYGKDKATPDVYISNDGKVGINKTNPTTELDVAGTIKATRIIADGFDSQTFATTPWEINGDNIAYNTGKVKIGDKWEGKDKLEQKDWYSSYAHFQINYEGDVDLNLWKTHPFAIAGDSRVMYMGTDEKCAYIQSYTFVKPWYTNLLLNPRGGNIGIGTINPVAKFYVAGNSDGTRAVMINDRELKFREEGVAHFSIFANRINETLTIENTSSSGLPGTPGSVLASFNRNGNVGIGTTVPNEKLTVKDGAILLEGNMASWTNSGWRPRIQSPLGTVWASTNKVNTGGNYYLGLGMTNTGWYFMTRKDNKTKRYVCVISDDGNIRSTAVKVEQRDWSDFVFNKKFELTPLNELENYINKNQHLPNMPTQKEIAKDGLDLGNMQKLQMQKIEELTLYILQLNKRIEKLEKENSKLKN